MDNQEYEPQPDTSKPPKLDGRIYKLGKRELAFILVTLLLLGGVAWYALSRDKGVSINSFAECVAAGNPVMESYPEQCAANGKTFTNSTQAQSQIPDTDETVLMIGPGTFEASSKLYSLDVPDGWQLKSSNSENPESSLGFSDTAGSCDASINLKLYDTVVLPGESEQQAEALTLQNIKDIALDPAANGYKTVTVSDVTLSTKKGVYFVGVTNGTKGNWQDEEVRKYTAYINAETILELAYKRQPEFQPKACVEVFEEIVKSLKM